MQTQRHRSQNNVDGCLWGSCTSIFLKVLWSGVNAILPAEVHPVLLTFRRNSVGSKVGKMESWEQMLHPTTTTQSYANHFWLWSINKASLSHTRHWAMTHRPSDCKRNPWSSFGSRLGPLVWAPLWVQEKQSLSLFPPSHLNIWCKRDFLKRFPLVPLPPPG